MLQSFSKKNRAERLFNIDFLKAIAVFLIINSHLDSLYPTSAIATGGALGNGLFFMVSGFLIRKKRKDIIFLLKSVIRIYFPMYIVYFVSSMQRGCFEKVSFRKFVWPTNYWFIGAIVLFYICYSLLDRIGVFYHFSIFIASSILIYFLWYVFFLDTSTWVVEKAGLGDIDSSFKLVYYFTIMMLGGYAVDSLKTKKIGYNYNIIWIISVIVMYYSKFLMMKYPEMMKYQFISQICVLLFSYYIFVSSFYWSNLGKLSDNIVLCLLIITISETSLECYLVQFSIIDLFKNVVFPLNVFSAVLLIFFSGILLKSFCILCMRFGNALLKRNGIN